MSLMDFVNNMHINENNHAPNLAPVLQVNNHPPPPLQPQNGDQQHGGEQMDGHNGEDPLQNEEQHNFGNNEELLQNHLDPLGGQEANDEDYDAEIDGEHSEDGDIGMLDAQGESDEDDANDHDVDDVPNDDDPDALIAHYNEVMAMFDQIPHHADFPLPPPPAAVAGVDNGGAQGVGEGEQMEEEENLFGNMFFGILDGNAGEVDFNELGTHLLSLPLFPFDLCMHYFNLFLCYHSGTRWTSHRAPLEGGCTRTLQRMLFSSLCIDPSCFGKISTSRMTFVSPLPPFH